MKPYTGKQKKGPFFSIIDKLKKTDNRVLKHRNYNVVKVGKEEPFNFYAVNTKEILGQGGFGKIYKAYGIDPSTGDLSSDEPPYAVKIIPEKRFKAVEAKILSKYYRTDSPQRVKVNHIFHSSTKVYLFSEFLPGRILSYSESCKLSFSERINVITQLFLWCNILHNRTPSTGAPIVHSDIKESNILFYKNPKGFLEVNLIDFGLSTEIKEGDIDSIVKLDHSYGTWGYAAPEVYKQMYTTKSDVYSMAQIVDMLLGQKDSFNTFTGQEKLSFNLRVIITKILNRMKQSNYKNRLSSAECLRTFIEINKLCQLISVNDKSSRDINIIGAKLILLANGAWNATIEKKKIYKNNTEYISSKKTFAQYDFSGNPDFCTAVIKVHEAGFFNKNSLSGLFLNIDNCCEKIARPGSNKRELSYLYLLFDDLDKQSLKHLLEINLYINENEIHLKQKFGDQLFSKLIQKLTIKIDALHTFQRLYKAECTNGWFLFFRSNMANKVYKNTLTQSDIDKRLEDNDQSSTTYTAYKKMNKNKQLTIDSAKNDEQPQKSSMKMNSK